MNGKGSRPRPTDLKRYEAGWDRVFAPKARKLEKRFVVTAELAEDMSVHRDLLEGYMRKRMEHLMGEGQ